MRYVGVLFLWSLVTTLLSFNCGDDWVKVADCATGPAWHIDDELICDDHMQTTFDVREWREDDNATTACAFCEGREP